MAGAGGRTGGAAVRDGLTGVAVAAFAIACCAGIPLAAGLVGGVAVGAWLGVGAGVLVVGVVIAVAISARRRARRPDEEQR
jgi:hypothetical protein